MNKVTLRYVAQVDLDIRIARPMGDNKIRHYRVPMPYIMLTGIKALDAVRDYITSEEGPTEFTLEDTIEPQRATGVPIKTVDLSEVVLKNDPKIRKALGKRTPESVKQWTVVTSRKHLFINPFKSFANFFINKINKIHYKYKIRALKIEMGYDPANHSYWFSDNDGVKIVVDRFAYLNIVQNPLIKPFNIVSPYIRRAAPCSFLTIQFEEGQEELAANEILADLRILEKNNLIIGHLALPSAILLADIVGSGKKYYAMFCFLFVDPDKLCKITNKTFFDLPQQPLHLIGVKNETPESGVGSNKLCTPYEIEEVMVCTMGGGDAHREYVQSYLDSVDEVNEISSGMAEAIKYVEDKE
jgi:hypothetical protein